ncbi:involucrin-like isoform X2 [Schistocerca gregaria]|uniref:involucrin-like isoform X2 n=1 Tax=Schistocerca gregaria TaxID=7010 RepID=UPI00211F1BE1|nr:involucrin-like isoform X2 [Schistocerca gregaria]
MKSSSLCKASLSATGFQLSQLPCKNKALADENANLRAKVAQLLDEKEKWQIKYCNLHMKVSDYTKYRKDVKQFLQRMFFYLQNFLAVRDMLDHMLQQETEYEEMEHHNTKAKSKSEPERLLKDENNELVRKEEQQQQKQEQQQQKQEQQQQHIQQIQLQNTSVGAVLQLSSKHNQTRKCVSEKIGEHHLHHPKDNTEFQSKEVHQNDQLIGFGHLSQQDKACSLTEEKQLQNVEKEEVLLNEAMQKSRLSNELQEHQRICLNLSGGNDKLKYCSSGKDLKLNLPEDQLLQLQKTVSQNCYPPKCDFLLKASQLYKENEPQQPLIKVQQDSVSDHFCQEKDCKACNQRTIHIKEMEQQVLEQQIPEDKGHQSLESASRTQYCECAKQQHAGLQRKLQTEHEHLNRDVQREKFLTAQKLSFADVQGQIITDQARQPAEDQGQQDALNQGMKPTVNKEEPPRNKQDNNFFIEHIRGTEQQTRTMEQRKHLTMNNGGHLSTHGSPKSMTINERQFTNDVDCPFSSDREQLFPIENRLQINVQKPLQSVEEEKRGDKRKSREYLSSINDELHSVERVEGKNTVNQETTVGMRQQLPVKLCHLLPASLHAALSFGKGQNLYQNEGKQQSAEIELQLFPEIKEPPMVNRLRCECGEQHIVKQLSKQQGQENNVKGQQLVSIEAQHRNNFPHPFGSAKYLQQPTVEQNRQLITVHGWHLTHYQLSGEAVQQSAMEKESSLTQIKKQQILGKEQSHCAEQKEQLIKIDQPFTVHQHHKLRSGKEQEAIVNQGLYTTTYQQPRIVSGQQQSSVSNKLQPGLGNKNQKLTNRQINQVGCDKELKLKAKRRKQFDKEEGLVPNTEQTRPFAGEHIQQITVKKMSELVSRYERGQPTLNQGQQQETLKQGKHLQREQGQHPTGEQPQQSVIEEIKGLAESEDCQQPAVERAEEGPVERFEQSFTKKALGLSAELSQEILMQTFQDTVTKEVKWLPTKQYQCVMTGQEWKVKGLQEQSTSTSHCEKELQEHSSVFLLSELSKTGFETSFNSSAHSVLHLTKKIQQMSTMNNTGFETTCNSSTQSVLRCAKKIQHKSTLNSAALHVSYMEDSIVKRIPVITEATICKTLDQHKVSHPESLDTLYNRIGRPRRKCTVGVNYFISP